MKYKVSSIQDIKPVFTLILFSMNLYQIQALNNILVELHKEQSSLASQFKDIINLIHFMEKNIINKHRLDSAALAEHFFSVKEKIITSSPSNAVPAIINVPSTSPVIITSTNTDFYYYVIGSVVIAVVLFGCYYYVIPSISAAVSAKISSLGDISGIFKGFGFGGGAAGSSNIGTSYSNTIIPSSNLDSNVLSNLSSSETSMLSSDSATSIEESIRILSESGRLHVVNDEAVVRHLASVVDSVYVETPLSLGNTSSTTGVTGIVTNLNFEQELRLKAAAAVKYDNSVCLPSVEKGLSAESAVDFADAILSQIN